MVVTSFSGHERPPSNIVKPPRPPPRGTPNTSWGRGRRWWYSLLPFSPRSGVGTRFQLRCDGTGRQEDHGWWLCTSEAGRDGCNGPKAHGATRYARGEWRAEKTDAFCWRETDEVVPRTSDRERICARKEWLTSGPNGQRPQASQGRRAEHAPGAVSVGLPVIGAGWSPLLGWKEGAQMGRSLVILAQAEVNVPLFYFIIPDLFSYSLFFWVWTSSKFNFEF
jgi:hypothetical protein